jgi:aconitate hydratase
VKLVLAKSFARIHRSNLINSGILPLTFDDPADFSALTEGLTLRIEDARAQIAAPIVEIAALESGKTIKARAGFSALELSMLRAGGRINMLKDASEPDARTGAEERAR